MSSDEILYLGAEAPEYLENRVSDSESFDVVAGNLENSADSIEDYYLVVAEDRDVAKTVQDQYPDASVRNYQNNALLDPNSKIGAQESGKIEKLHNSAGQLMEAETVIETLQIAASAANNTLGFDGTGVRVYDEENNNLEHIKFGGRVDEIESRPPTTLIHLRTAKPSKQV